MSVLAACGSSPKAIPRTAYGPEGVAVEKGTLLAPAAATGRTADGVPCRAPAKPAYHVHTHLAVYVDGALRPIPAGIGMVDPKAHQTTTGPDLYGPRCYYDLHVHAQDGVIHVEGPKKRPYTLGQFFAVWGQPLSPHQVGPAHGRLTVYLDGQPVTQDPRTIVLTEHHTIQIDVGTDVPFTPVDWSHF